VRSALSPKEYRDFAAQCLRWAGRARSEAHMNAMLDMAHHWMQTAHELECAARSIDELRRKRPTSMVPRRETMLARADRLNKL
jgi:hypothetical protein